jgi:hypothetical protein
VRLKALVSAQRRLASFDGSIDELAALVPGFALDAIEATGAVFELFEGDALVAKAASPALAGLHRHALPARRQPVRRSLQDQPDAELARCASRPRIASAIFDRFQLRSVIVSVVHGHQGVRSAC